MNLLPIPAFSDNYIWMLHDAEHAVVVDPGQAEPVLSTLAQRSETAGH
jgi:hydroxyacylglutathione hydrolase